jgi:hypothetical protein
MESIAERRGQRIWPICRWKLWQQVDTICRWWILAKTTNRLQYEHMIHL